MAVAAARAGGAGSVAPRRRADSRPAPAPRRESGDSGRFAETPRRPPAADDASWWACRSTRPCWVSATVDGQTAIERLLQPGEQQTLEVRREIVLTVGDARPITLTLNGADARPLGKTGEVVTARLNLTNFKDYPGGAVNEPTPLLDFFKRGEVARDVRLAGRPGRAGAARARAARASSCCSSRIPTRRFAPRPTTR